MCFSYSGEIITLLFTCQSNLLTSHVNIVFQKYEYNSISQNKYYTSYFYKMQEIPDLHLYSSFYYRNCKEIP